MTQIKNTHGKLSGRTLLCGVSLIASVAAVSPALATAGGAPDDGMAIRIGSEAGQVPAESRLNANPHQIEVRTDSTHIDPVLAAALADSHRIVVRGDMARFVSYNNYPDFIERGEIRIFEQGQSPSGEPLAIIALDANGFANWQSDAMEKSDLLFVYRAWGHDGRYDETAPQELTLVDQRPQEDNPPTRPLFGTADEAVVRNISLARSATVTVTGHARPDDQIVRVGAQFVAVDSEGKFVSQQIVPRNTKQIWVRIGTDGNTSYTAMREIDAKSQDWFIVGQGDLTLGHSWSSGPARIVSGDSLAEGSYAVGRAAFYAKGLVGDDIRITSSVDTGETLVKDLFSNLDRKDPRQLLRRLNSEQYYPTYGDDSTLVEDAPTQGRFYLRAEKDASQFVIGNFVMRTTGTDLAQLDRGVFGALLDYNSTAVTSFGERKVQVTGFASDPGTVPAREELRGTGGSLYYLKRQDISIGSERVRVEVRDPTTGLVLESHDLNPQQDYDFDPYQGRLTLLRPLSSTVATSGTVRDGSSPGNIPVLVVNYEYTPAVGDLTGYTLGGRAAAWIGETLRLGATAQRDTQNEAEQTLLGADALVRITAGTYAKAEIAQTKGPGFGQSNSVDGGLTFNDIASPGLDRISRAWRTEVAVNVAELMGKQGDLGKASAWYEHRDAGFSASGQLAPTDTERWGAQASLPLGANGSVAASYDVLDAAGNGRNRTGKLDIANRFATAGGTVTTKAGLRYEGRTPGLLYNSVEDGDRLDGAVELAFKPAGSNLEFSGFGQATLDRDASRYRNNRVGLGLKAELTDRLSFHGEASEGDGGLGMDLKLNRRLGDGSEAYVGYALYTDRTDTGLEPQNLFNRRNGGNLVVGARQRFSDSLSVYGENRIGIGGSAPSLSRSFGLEFEPAENFSVNGTFENGRIDDATTGLFRRTAASLAVGYTTDEARIGSAIEMRNDKGSGRDQTAILWRNNLSLAISDDWRLIGEFNRAWADNESPSINAADYTEAVAGFAWRPVHNERVNALMRLQYYEDLGPVGQVTGSGQTQSPKQESTIFSLDANYDLTEKLTLGGKYGYRQGKVSLGRDSDLFVSSNAHLAVVRADYNIVRQWDVLAEGRALWVTQADDMRLGALGAVYRHLGNNVKIGVGYSWSDFSDDLSDQSYSSHGPFLNLIGKF
ncbi:MAG: hypothetical protein ACK5NN_12540 [Sphingomonadaceae bacterium]